jgi:hypothetical protein
VAVSASELPSPSRATSQDLPPPPPPGRVVEQVDPTDLGGLGSPFDAEPDDDPFFGNLSRLSEGGPEPPATADDPFGFGDFGLAPDGGLAEHPPQRPGASGALPPDAVVTNPASAVPTRAKEGRGAPPVRGEPTAPPPVHSTISIGASVSLAPWEREEEPPSLLPKMARVASSLPVSYWARGRNHAAMAQNFGREGLFLSATSQLPVRGAIIRIEFPLEGDGETVPVRFNAEVRWHRADRPGPGLPDGFGVQILTFETPKDRARYEELLALLLQLPTEPAENPFSWEPAGSRRGGR